MPAKRSKKRDKRRVTRRQHAYRPPAGKPGTAFTGSNHCSDCGKWCYPTRDAAEQAVRRMHPGAKVHYYECGDSWHFTSMTSWQVAEIRERRAVNPRDLAPE